MKNFISFVQAQSLNQREGHAMGFVVSDKDYFQRNLVALELPGLMQSQEFLRLLNDPDEYRQAVEMIERKNEELAVGSKWEVLVFKARFIKSVDRTTYGRMLVYVPGDLGRDGRIYDKWITLGIVTPDGESVGIPKSVSIVSIDLAANSAYFMDYGRLEGSGGEIALVPTAQILPNPSKNCYDCHKSPVVPIRPEVEFVFDEHGALVPAGSSQSTKLNALIRKYKEVRIAGLDTRGYGPSLGKIGGGRLGSIDCASCHDDFAPLNFPEGLRTDREVRSIKDKRGIAQTFVEEGWMPPGNNLSRDERRTLWKALENAYFDRKTMKGALVDWLKGGQRVK